MNIEEEADSNRGQDERLKGSTKTENSNYTELGQERDEEDG